MLGNPSACTSLWQAEYLRPGSRVHLITGKTPDQGKNSGELLTFFYFISFFDFFDFFLLQNLYLSLHEQTNYHVPEPKKQNSKLTCDQIYIF